MPFHTILKSNSYIIKSLAVHGQIVNISYERFRSEIVNACGEDFLPPKPKKIMGSLTSDLRACGIKIEIKNGVKGLLSDGSHDTASKKGFSIYCMTDGSLMASAMPN